jgi:long-subunit acyl-CoA synthetase (AMP-forming)
LAKSSTAIDIGECLADLPQRFHQVLSSHATETLTPPALVEDDAVSNAQAGELHVRGRNVMRRCYRSPDLTAQAIDKDSWFNIPATWQGFEGEALFIVGRTKEPIVRSVPATSLNPSNLS